MTPLRLLGSSLFVLLTATCSLHAAEPDFTIELGKRVGAIKKSSTLAQIKEAYGAKNVKSANLPGPEGTTLKGAILFKGGDREMHVIWNDEKPEKEVFDVQLIGKAWVIGDKLKLGASIADVEAVNGGAFKVSGFDWDMGGYRELRRRQTRDQGHGPLLSRRPERRIALGRQANPHHQQEAPRCQGHGDGTLRRLALTPSVPPNLRSFRAYPLLALLCCALCD